MSWEKIAQDLTFYAFYTATKAGKTGLTVTVDVWEHTRTGTATEVVTAGNAVEIGDGLYKYVLAAASVDAIGEYVAVFKTADTSVDQKDIPALWTVGRADVAYRDAAVSTRATPATAMTAIMTEPVPGAYASGTVAAALGRIGSAGVTIVSPVGADGSISLVLGDDYLNADGRALTFTFTNCPTLTGGTIALRVLVGATELSFAGTVTGAAACRVELTRTQIATIGIGIFPYTLRATLVTSTDVATLVQGTLIVSDDLG